MLNSYSTTRFALFLKVPILPTGKFQIVAECPHCGQRGITTYRKFSKERKRNLDLMMDGFTTDADNPDNCCHALHTLMIYGEQSWFSNVRKSYGMRFETNPRIQYIIAQGLCRFGDYPLAITYCQKAIALGAGREAAELLEFCHTLMATAENQNGFDHLKVSPESASKAYVPIAALAATVSIAMALTGISAMRNHYAWLVNGSLQPYRFILDGSPYTLKAGARRHIKLRLGKHELKMEKEPVFAFEYSMPIYKQLLGKHLLVVNPDEMALLMLDEGHGTNVVFGQKIHRIPGTIHSWLGFQALEKQTDRLSRIGLFRPDTHGAMVTRLNELYPDGKAAAAYARHALAMSPETDEAPKLLDVALAGLDHDAAVAFLETGTAIDPPLLPWHIHYQDHALAYGSKETLVREYTQSCKAHPDDPEFYFLLARIVPNTADAYALFRHSEKGRGMHGMGYYEIARSQFIRGEFEEALESSALALELNPGQTEMEELHEQLLLATRRYDMLLATIDQQDPQNAAKTVLYLTCAGYHREAENAIARFGSALPEGGARLNAIRFHAVGNMEDYLRCLADSGDSHAELERCLSLGDIAGANRLVSADENHPWWEHLVLYCADMNLHETEMANVHLEKASTELGDGTPAKKEIAKLLATEIAPELDAIRQLDIAPREKALLCAALGYRFPERQAAFFQLSLKYNFTPAYPQNLLKKWEAPALKQASKTAVFQCLEPAA
jgi:tetratricopeptide (TPR) repeat protein